MKAVRYENGCLFLLDQTLLPDVKRTVVCRTYEETAEAIKTMQVRGAPAIGVAAAYGLVLAARQYKGEDRPGLDKFLQQAKEHLAATRPTAVNLFWALGRMEEVWVNTPHASCSAGQLREMLEREAILIDAEDLDRNKKIGWYGNTLIPARAAVLTHCNAGALATAGYGTALGVIRAACEEGKEIKVFADETRPLLQGARLTAWELLEDNIPVTLIADSMAGYLMQQGKIDLVVVGADRITARGDVANKIGTYSLAVLASFHGVPFYVAAPLSTIDLAIASGEDITIEERDHDEIRKWGDVRLAPAGADVYNPAFDITPARLITAIITDGGIVRSPYEAGLSRLFDEEKIGGKQHSGWAAD